MTVYELGIMAVPSEHIEIDIRCKGDEDGFYGVYEGTSSELVEMSPQDWHKCVVIEIATSGSGILITGQE